MVKSDMTIDTPHGPLHVVWSAPPKLYFDDADETGVADPLAVADPPVATLNGVDITIERAKEILAEMIHLTIELAAE